MAIASSSVRTNSSTASGPGDLPGAVFIVEGFEATFRVPSRLAYSMPAQVSPLDPRDYHA